MKLSRFLLGLAGVSLIAFSLMLTVRHHPPTPNTFQPATLVVVTASIGKDGSVIDTEVMQKDVPPTYQGLAIDEVKSSNYGLNNSDQLIIMVIVPIKESPNGPYVDHENVTSERFHDNDEFSQPRGTSGQITTM